MHNEIVYLIQQPESTNLFLLILLNKLKINVLCYLLVSYINLSLNKYFFIICRNGFSHTE